MKLHTSLVVTWLFIPGVVSIPWSDRLFKRDYAVSYLSTNAGVTYTCTGDTWGGKPFVSSTYTRPATTVTATSWVSITTTPTRFFTPTSTATSYFDYATLVYGAVTTQATATVSAVTTSTTTQTTTSTSTRPVIATTTVTITVTTVPAQTSQSSSFLTSASSASQSGSGSVVTPSASQSSSGSAGASSSSQSSSVSSGVSSASVSGSAHQRRGDPLPTSPANISNLRMHRRWNPILRKRGGDYYCTPFSTVTAYPRTTFTGPATTQTVAATTITVATFATSTWTHTSQIVASTTQTVVNTTVLVIPTTVDSTSWTTTTTTVVSLHSSTPTSCATGGYLLSPGGVVYDQFSTTADYSVGGAGVAMSSMQACLQYCEDLGTARCLAVVWVKAGQAKQYCYPKTSLAVSPKLPLTITAYSAVRHVGITACAGQGTDMATTVNAICETGDYAVATNGIVYDQYSTTKDYSGVGASPFVVKSSLKACLDYCESMPRSGCVGVVWVASGQAFQYCYPKTGTISTAAFPKTITAFSALRNTAFVGCAGAGTVHD